MFWLIFSAGAVTGMAALTYRLSQGHEGLRMYALWFAGVCIVVAGVAAAGFLLLVRSYRASLGALAAGAVPYVPLAALPFSAS